jgi:heat-inducible transcriptional repressor
MLGASVVSTTYGSSGKVYGGMGVVGPTRMDLSGNDRQCGRRCSLHW